MPKNRNLLLSILILCLIVIAALIYYFSTTTHVHGNLPTYFQYNKQELSSLRKINPHGKMSKNELANWDVAILDLIRKNSLRELESSKILAYLYTAQRDAAYLSYNLHGDFVGSLDPVSKGVLCIFFSAQCSEFYTPKAKDKYSEELAKIVLAKVMQRIKEDQQGVKPYPVKEESQYWQGEKPYYGQDTGSWKTWFLTSSSQFRAPPPSFELNDINNQVTRSKSTLTQATDAQKKAVVFWAGGPGTITPPGQWISLANDYMWHNDVDFKKMLLVRSVLAMAMADAIIAVFDSKYTYLFKRPFMHDPSIKSIMPTPNHPSYPAAHSSISAAAATVLSYYFPDQKERWQSIAKEAGLSRIWGGIHFHQDDIAGIKLGDDVAEYAIKQSEKNSDKR